MNTPKIKRVLIFGANGFLGRYLLQACIDRSWNIDVIIHSHKDKIPNTVRTYNLSALEKLSNNYDVVFLSVGNFSASIEELIDANITLTRRVVKKFPKSRIVFISSSAVYGIHEEKINELSSFNNPNIYGWSKIAGEFITKAHNNASVIRLSALYGPCMNENLFIAKITREAKSKKAIRIYGKGSRFQDYLYVKDAASLCILAAEHQKCNTYLGAYGQSFSNNEMANIVKSLIKKTIIKYTGKDESPSFRFDASFTNNELNFSPNYTPEKGIKEMLMFYEQ